MKEKDMGMKHGAACKGKGTPPKLGVVGGMSQGGMKMVKKMKPVKKMK